MMSTHRQMTCVLLLLVLLPGCSWWRGWIKTPQAPTAFTGPPSLEQIAQQLNSNPIRQLESEGARISIDGFPSLPARLALERPRNLRFRVESLFGGGAELDLGSNHELFWMWAKRNQPPAVLYARHDQFAGSRARQMIPIQPEWIGETLGVLYFDPAGQHEGPHVRGNHRLEVRTRLPQPDGDMTRVLVINDVYGWILEQHLLDARGQPVASAKTSEHRYYAEEGVSLPHRIEIQLPAAQLAFTLDVARFRINALAGEQAQLWTMPQFTDRPINVADPSFGAGSNPVPGSMPVASPVAPRVGFRPQVRGLE